MKKTPCNLGVRLDHPVYWKKNKQNAEAKEGEFKYNSDQKL